MTAQLRRTALQWRAEGRKAVVVEVLAKRGSVPREAGTRMLVSADEVIGTIGGGHLELKAIEKARRLLAEAATAPVDEDIAPGPTLGQCCGGALSLRHGPLAVEDPALWPQPAPRFFLQLYGAGHVGRAVVQLLSGIDCRVQWTSSAALGGGAHWAPRTRPAVRPAREVRVPAAPPARAAWRWVPIRRGSESGAASVWAPAQPAAA